MTAAADRAETVAAEEGRKAIETELAAALADLGNAPDRIAEFERRLTDAEPRLEAQVEAAATERRTAAARERALEQRIAEGERRRMAIDRSDRPTAGPLCPPPAPDDRTVDDQSCRRGDTARGRPPGRLIASAGRGANKHGIVAIPSEIALRGDSWIYVGRYRSAAPLVRPVHGPMSRRAEAFRPLPVTPDSIARSDRLSRRETLQTAAAGSGLRAL